MKFGSRYGKYNAKRVKTPEGWFDSTGEYSRWLDLLKMARAGVITALKRQVEFPLMVNETLVCKYKADYCYLENGREVVEDFKGKVTAEFKIKAKLFYAVYGKPILVSTKNGCSDYPKPVKKKKENKTYGKKTGTHNPLG